MPIRPLPFANALAVTTALLGIFLIILRLAAPDTFLFVFNAQFFGADVASLLPAELNIPRIIGEFVAFVGGAWAFGLVGALVYNKFIGIRQ